MRGMARYRDGHGREPLTRERIARAALGILDSEGMDALTMRRLGDELGVEAMSLYHHFSGKDAILDAVCELLVAETAADPRLAGCGRAEARAALGYTAGWHALAWGHGGSWAGPGEADLAAAADSAPLTAALAGRLRDWGRGRIEGLHALLDGLELRRAKRGEGSDDG